MNKVNLSDFSTEFLSMSDLDDIISSETRSQNLPVEQPNNTPAPQQQQQPSRIDYKDTPEYKAHSDLLNNLDADAQNSNVPVKQYDDDFYADDDLFAPVRDNKPEQREDTKPSLNENSSPYEIALNLAQELDLIRVPNDIKEINADTLRYLADVTKEEQFNEAIEHIKYNISDDPYFSDLIDYALEGGRFADLPKMQQILRNEYDYATLDVNNTDVQKLLVKKFLSEGLDPNDPRDKELLNLIPVRINQMINQLTLAGKAREAQQYFVERQQQIRDEEYQRVAELRQDELDRQLAADEENRRWNYEFSKVLQNSKLSDSKKQVIKEQFHSYELEDGTVLPLWQIKQKDIYSDPVLFAHYLNFLSGYDAEQRKFVNTPTVQKNTILEEIENNLNKKSQNGSGNSNRVNMQDPNRKTNNVVDPRKDLFY